MVRSFSGLISGCSPYLLSSFWLQVYDEAYHALHKELPEVTSSVFKEIKSWLGQKLSACQEAHRT